MNQKSKINNFDLTQLILLYELFDHDAFYSFREMQRIGLIVDDWPVKIKHQDLIGNFVGRCIHVEVNFENLN